MRRLALLGLLAAPLVVGCQSTTRSTQEPFAQPNELMGQEIRKRIAEIQYQHREELLNNLLWLVQTGEQAIPSLVDNLQSEHAKVRSNCLWCLGSIGDKRTIAYVQPMLEDQEKSVRLEAARTLVTLGDLQATPMLIEALDSEKTQVRYLCHEALKQVTGRDFGFDHLSENLVDRRKAVLGWRQWWSRQADDVWFAKQYAAQHGLMMEGEGDPEWRGGQEGQPAAPMGETEMTPWVPNPGAKTGQPETQPGTETNHGESGAMNQPETAQPETQPQTQPKTQPESTQPNPTQPESTQPSTTQPEATKPQPGTEKAHTNQPTPTKLPPGSPRAQQIKQVTQAMHQAIQKGDHQSAIDQFQAQRPQIQVGSNDPDYEAYAAAERLYLQARLALELNENKSGENKTGSDG